MPLIKIYKVKDDSKNAFAGLKIGSSIITGHFMKGNLYASSLTFDCETQNIYSEDLNLNFNDTVSVDNGFPKFNLGDTVITFDTDVIEKMEVIPRWWDL